ncbi:MAG: TrkH family potassium uptake protein, partial [Spirochaetes bacterium]|nr:TrkH family potassium uptake protein [Candidatus Ornithospirochaeta stercoravium]
MNMDYRSVILFLAFIMLFIALVMLVPLLIAVSSDEYDSIMGFLKTIILMLAVSLIAIAFTWKRKELNIGTKEATLIVSLTWIIMTAFGALPMYFSGAIPSYTECFFEIMSG